LARRNEIDPVAVIHTFRKAAFHAQQKMETEVNMRACGRFRTSQNQSEAYPLIAWRKVSPAIQILGTETVGKIKRGAGILSENQTSRARMEAALRNTAFTSRHFAVCT